MPLANLERIVFAILRRRMPVLIKDRTKFKPILRFTRGHWGAIGLVLLVTLASSLMTAAVPWPLKLLVDGALKPDGAPPWMSSFDWSPMIWIGVAAVATVLVGLGTTVLETLTTWLWSKTGHRMVYQLSAALFERMQRLSLRFHHRSHVGDLLSRLTDDAFCIFQVMQGLVIGPAQGLLTVGLLGAVAFWLDPFLATLLLASTPLIALGVWFFGPKIRRAARRRQESRAALASFVQRMIPAAPLVQVFTAEPQMRDRFRLLADDVASDLGRTKFLESTFASVNGLGANLGVGLVLVVGGFDVLAGTLTLGSLLVFIQYARSMQGSLVGLLNNYSTLRQGEASVDRVVEVLHSEEVVEEPTHAVALPVAKDAARGRIDFNKATFGYEPGLTVLHDIDLHVSAGQSVALVGRSGAGKTTLASLVPRFFDVWSGSVQVESIDVRHVRLRDLRRQVAIVPQQPLLMPVSVADNIAYGWPDASREQVVEAARAANADGFIRQLPEGYDTVLSERGADLSGGECQRLSIARAVLTDAAIIILDEPTSALDSDSELVVLDALKRLTRRRTSLIIAHRLSTARAADRIVVMDEGRVVEDGSHQELVTRGGVYARFHELQSGTGTVIG